MESERQKTSGLFTRKEATMLGKSLQQIIHRDSFGCALRE